MNIPKNFQELTFEGITIIVWYHDEDSKILLEANHSRKPLIGSYSFNKHQPHSPPGQYHLHVYDKNNQIFAINMDGSAHDKFHGVRIPNKVYKELASRFSDWAFPPDQIIESQFYCYILRSIDDLSFKELSNEVKYIREERDLLADIIKNPTPSLIFEEYDASLFLSQIDKLDERIRLINIELIDRLEKK